MSAVPRIVENPGVADEQQIRSVVQHELANSAFANIVRQVQGKTTVGTLNLANPGTARKIAFGADTLTWTASNTSATKHISHGLGVVPVAVLAVGSGGAIVLQAGFNATTTQFDVFGQTNDLASISATLGFNWLAIG